MLYTPNKNRTNYAKKDQEDGWAKRGGVGAWGGKWMSKGGKESDTYQVQNNIMTRWQGGGFGGSGIRNLQIWPYLSPNPILFSMSICVGGPAYLCVYPKII